MASRINTTSAAPRQAPHSDPAPPMITASSAKEAVVNPRSAGVTRRCWAISSEPANPATAPASTNTAYLAQ